MLSAKPLYFPALQGKSGKSPFCSSVNSLGKQLGSAPTSRQVELLFLIFRFLGTPGLGSQRSGSVTQTNHSLLVLPVDTNKTTKN